MRPLKGSLFKPACALLVNRATVRAHRGSRRLPALVRAHVARVVITIVTVAGWSSWNMKVVPRLREAAAVRPCSGVDARATANTALVSASREMVGRVLVPVLVVGTAAPGGGGAAGAAGDTGYS